MAYKMKFQKAVLTVEASGAVTATANVEVRDDAAHGFIKDGRCECVSFIPKFPATAEDLRAGGLAEVVKKYPGATEE